MDVDFLVQGTPETSSNPSNEKQRKLSFSHNAGGLPKDMQFELIEPPNTLFKDEVRALEQRLACQIRIVWRQTTP